MGSWGVGIFQNDIADEIKDCYINKLKSGKNDKEALAETIRENSEMISEDDDKFDFWFALSSITFDYGRITDEIKTTALELIESGDDLKRWDSKADQRKRSVQLEKLREKLLSETPPPKKVRIIKPTICPWKKNEIYLYKLDSEIYRSTEFYNSYMIILVDSLLDMSFYVEDVIDRYPITYLKLTKEIPQSIQEINSLEFIANQEDEYRFFWCGSSLKNSKKHLIYWGEYDFERKVNSAYFSDRDDVYLYILDNWKNRDRVILKDF